MDHEVCVGIFQVENAETQKCKEAGKNLSDLANEKSNEVQHVVLGTTVGNVDHRTIRRHISLMKRNKRSGMERYEATSQCEGEETMAGKYTVQKVFSVKLM